MASVKSMKGKTIILIVLVLAAVCFGVVFYPTLQVHTGEQGRKLLWELTESQNEEGQNLFTVSFRCMDERRKVTKIVTSDDENGNVNLQVVTRGIPLLAPADPERRYYVDISDTDDMTVQKITLRTDVVLWEDGVTVDRHTALLFLYAADNSVSVQDNVDTLLGLLGVGSWLPDHTAKLQKTASGYKLTVAVSGNLVAYQDYMEKTGDYEEELEDTLKKLKKASCLLLALIDGLDEVTWDYSANGKKDSLRSDASDAAAMLGPENGGSGIKEYGKTAAGLQKLIDALSFESGVLIG